MKRATLFAALAAFVVLTMTTCSTLMDIITDPAKLGQAIKTGQAVAKAAEPIDPEEEYYLGRAVTASILWRYRPWTGADANEYLNTLGGALALASPKPETFRGYHFMVLDTDDINAFGAPSGFVVVSRGLLRCATNEDEVAAILAHEISHVSLQHGLKAISASRWTSAGVEGLKLAAMTSHSSAVRDINAVFGDMIGDIIKTMVNSGYSQELEKEADLEAIQILHDVGYDPAALVRVLQRMKPRLKAGGTDFVKTHPAPDMRIAYLQPEIQKLGPPRPINTLQKANRQSRYAAAMAGI